MPPHVEHGVPVCHGGPAYVGEKMLREGGDPINLKPGDHVCGITYCEDDEVSITVDLVRGALLYNHKVFFPFVGVHFSSFLYSHT